MKNITFLFISILLIFSSLSAEVVTDGSLGTKLDLPGPDFQITADLGQQVGGNLFHSFQDFNLQSHESATFSGSDNVNIIFSRVTGGNPSNIDGLIRSTIPNAELFLLNPAGIILGEQAQLDVQGGFHASTADYMRLGEDGRFSARYPEQSILTVAPPMAFGFLDSPTEIKIQGSQLTVAPKADLSIVGGNLILDHGNLLASSGRINLVSVASTGEVTAKLDRLDARVPDTASFAKLGQIQMIDSQIETSGSPAGGISIRSGQFWMDNSLIHAHNVGSNEGKGIDIEVSDSMSMVGKDDSVYEHADHKENFGITSDTFSTGKAGQVTITVPRLEMQHNAIDVSTRGTGEGGNINIQTQQMYLNEGVEILSNVYDSGHGGQININATERLELSDHRIFETSEEAKNSQKTWIQTNTFDKGNGGDITIDTDHLQLFGAHILSNIDDQGHGGTITVNANTMEMLNGSAIVSGVLLQGIGNSGEIRLNVADTLTLSGFRPGWINDGSLSIQNMQTGIAPTTSGQGQSGLLEISTKNLIISDHAMVGSLSVGSGNAGSMIIDVDNLYLQQGGILTSSSGGILGGELWLATGDGGTLSVTAKQDIIIEGHNPFYPSSIATNTFHSGLGGNIVLQANRLIARDGGTVTTNSLGTSNAGNIYIKANEIHLSQGGEITAAAMQELGGNLVVNVSYLLYLQDGHITTSVVSDTGDGGNITIENPQFIVINHGNIIAQADAGNGGNIRIIAEQFIKSPHSLISASSRLGVDGNVNIEALDETVSDSLTILSEDRMDASAMMKKPCTAEDLMEENRSHFYVNPINGVRPAPHDRQGSDVLPARPQATTAQHTPVAFVSTGCRKVATQNASPSLF